MNILKLLLLEDQPEEASEITAFLSTNGYSVTPVKNIQEAEKEIKNHLFDIIILDIMINGKPDGIRLAQNMAKQDITIPFLFLTSMQSKYIFEEAKLTHPSTYLLKPYNELELLFSLELAIEAHYKQSNTISFDSDSAVLGPTYIFIKKSKSVMKVVVDSINYIEVKEKYCNLICTEGNFLIKLSLIKVKELLSNPIFIQVHRNFLVNVQKVKEIYFKDNLIILDSKDKIPFSERYKASFMKMNNILG
ncbi:LytR/AlgR family response regulator transcription factor [Aquimarina longa]|uniref:LytR/AlgR family response regulator transcription factor n=1 Tax=Aquimarina longa TaxID=1080221 RepID=UPI00078215B6|nr:LytTR family DNA-binding domain-containing protein [Aquimarina longa]